MIVTNTILNTDLAGQAGVGGAEAGIILCAHLVCWDHSYMHEVGIPTQKRKKKSRNKKHISWKRKPV